MGLPAFCSDHLAGKPADYRPCGKPNYEIYQVHFLILLSHFDKLPRVLPAPGVACYAPDFKPLTFQVLLLERAHAGLLEPRTFLEHFLMLILWQIPPGRIHLPGEIILRRLGEIKVGVVRSEAQNYWDL